MKIPTVLCNNRQWVCWRYDHAGNGDTPESRPYCPNNGLEAKLDDPGTWGTYEEACQAREKNGYAGIGYVNGWEFAKGQIYPYFFLNWGSPAGAFGFTDELPYMGCVWWILILLLFLIIIGWCYLAIADKVGKNSQKKA